MIKIIILVLLLYGCSSPEIEVSGNIDKQSTISESGRLDSILEDYDSQAAFLITNDGTSVYLPASSYPFLSIYQSEGEFHAQADSLPTFCNLKNITEISLFNLETPYTLTILEDTQTKEIITPFSARVAEFRNLGASSRYGNYASKYVYSSPFRLHLRADSMLTLCKDGQYRWVERDTFSEEFSLRSNHFKLGTDTLKAIWENPPQTDIFDLHKLIGSYPEPLLVIIIDSYGYTYHQHLRYSGSENYLHSLDLQPLRAAYPPKSRYNIWALGSGKRLQTRKSEDLLFDSLSHDNPIFVGGSMQLFEKNINFVSAIDTLEYDDNAIFTQACELIQALKHDLIIVHFTSIDQAGHEHGAYSRARLAQTDLVSSYISELMVLWENDVLLLSDHGMHTKNGKGTHYQAIDEDIISIWGLIK